MDEKQMRIIKRLVANQISPERQEGEWNWFKTILKNASDSFGMRALKKVLYLIEDVLPREEDVADVEVLEIAALDAIDAKEEVD